MISLPNNCYCSELKVNPSNWKVLKKLSKSWFIYYRFHDPNAKSNGLHLKGKLVTVQGMNHFKTVKERRDATEKLLAQELKKLKDGYNPISGDKSLATNEGVLNTSTPFIKALEMVSKDFSGAASTRNDIQMIIRFSSKAASQLHLDTLPICQITRKHIKMLLMQIEKDRGGESSHRHNKVRSYLMVLFKELVELETIENNPVREVSKKQKVQRLRPLLSLQERKLVNDYLLEHDRPFWIFTNIFFHSGARLTELMKLQAKDVNLIDQTFKVLVIKGRSKQEVIKPIKDVALPFWKEALNHASPENYVFSDGLQPGIRSIRSDQVTKRWYRHIKIKLDIKADFYSLKHSNLDETAALLSIQDASKMASHSSVSLTRKYYAIGEKDREIERLKVVNNKFA